MLPPAPDPYRPPAADLDLPSPSASDGSLAARVAGGFLILRAVVSGTMSIWSLLQRPYSLPGAALAGALVPTAVMLIVDGLLAVPLLRGSVRFRVVTWVRTLLSVVSPLLLSLSFLTVRRSMTSSRMLMGFYVQSATTACLFAAGMILLVQRGQRRWRLVAGIACLVLYLLAQALPRLISFSSS